MSEPAIRITKLPARNLSLLQVQVSDDDQLRDLADRLLSLSAPGREPHEGPRACALSPTEWLLKDVPRHRVRHALCKFGRMLSRVTDVSASFTLYRIAGPAAQSLLVADRGATCEAPADPPGKYARTRLGCIDVILECVSEDCFHLYVDRSQSPILEAWLRSRRQSQFPTGECTMQ